jgi:site-specific recombinase XerD
MATVKVLLYTSKILKNGEHPIMLRIINNRKSKYISIGYSCHYDLWDHENNVPHKKHPNKKLLDIVIKQKCVDAERLLLDYDDKKKPVSLDEVSMKIKKKKGIQGVIPFLDKIIADLKKADRIGNANVYNDLRRTMIAFRGNQNFDFSDVTVSFLNKFEQSFREKKFKDTSISCYMRTLRSLFNKAIASGEIDRDIYPFNEYKITKFKMNTIKRAISREDMRKIEELQIESGTRLFHSRNYFLFSFYNSGINFSDIASLTWKNISDERLSYKRMKTGRNYNIAILKPAQDILMFYKECMIDEQDYIFPILSKARHLTETSRKNRIHKILVLTNTDLNTISEKAELKTKLTTYVARHSYATVLKKSGISTSIISEAMGHSSERTTQIYLDSFENTVLDEANKNIL